VTAAIRRSIDSQLSLWDALIVETALAEGADLLVNEDLHDGWQIGSLRVWNPFSEK
jgi:predicted nucleic acid-binding protein